jgi:hypothetical protein
MDRASLTTSTPDIVQASWNISHSLPLPDDVLPNIYSRLPTPELFALASVSKQVQHSIQPLLRDAAEQRLGAFSFSPRDLEKSVRDLVALLRIAGRHISDEAWTNFLQKAEASNIDPRLIVVLRLSVAGENTAPGKHPDTVWVATSDIWPEVISGTETAWLICAAGMKEMMRVERLGVVSNVGPTQLGIRPAWKQLASIFNIFSLRLK